MGLVQRLLPPDEVLPATLAYARAMATECAPHALRHIKSMLRSSAERNLPEAYAESIPVIRASLHGPDMAEGVAARRSGRKPEFLPRGSS